MRKLALIAAVPMACCALGPTSLPSTQAATASSARAPRCVGARPSAADIASVRRAFMHARHVPAGREFGGALFFRCGRVEVTNIGFNPTASAKRSCSRGRPNSYICLAYQDQPWWKRTGSGPWREIGLNYPGCNQLPPGLRQLFHKKHLVCFVGRHPVF